MLTLLDQLDKGTLWHSPGGIHPPQLKTLSNQADIGRLPLANQFIVPVPQVGDLATLLVAIGDHVLKGQRLTQGKGFTYLPVHAPTSGTVIAIEARPSNHPSGLPVLSCVIQADGQDTWCELSPSTTKSTVLSNANILEKIKQAGIAGMGGAAFPSHIKLNPASDIELVIINGVECEPYITADDTLMRQHADDIVSGISIINQLLNPQRIIIAIEDNKPEAVNAMQAAIDASGLSKPLIRVTIIPTKYPSGGEKQLIQIISGKEVPSGTIPAQLGVVVHNVGTAFAIHQAVNLGKPLIERVVTLTGQQVTQPGNYWLPIGTPLAHALTQVGFTTQAQQKLIVGGPMMGYAINELNVPILKGTNCLLAPNQQEIGPDLPEQACIRCGECAVVCPALLLPQQLFWHAKAEEYDKAASFNLNDCIECGCCSYVCPSDIPLVEYYRVAKSALKNAAAEKQQAELAKQRFEARLERLESEKQAREAKAKQAAEKRKQAMNGNDKDAVAAAMARIAAKKKATETAQTSEKPAKSAAVSAAIERAKAKKAAKQNNAATADVQQNDAVPAKDTAQQPAEAPTNKADKIAAAVARAKAKKAALKAADGSATANDTTSSQKHPTAKPDTETSAAPVSAADAKKAKIAAAVAKAKAKKAAQQNAMAAETNTAVTAEGAHTQTVTETAPVSAADAKKAKIAAAVAKAKAKKAAQQTATEAETNTAVTAEVAYTQTVTETAPVSAADAQKAKIAAAVAKAKAKKAAQKMASKADTAEAESVESELKAETAPKADTEVNTTAGNNASAPVEPLSPSDIKKAKIAAAVAKAKAKKLAKQQQED